MPHLPAQSYDSERQLERSPAERTMHRYSYCGPEACSVLTALVLLPCQRDAPSHRRPPLAAFLLSCTSDAPNESHGGDGDSCMACSTEGHELDGMCLTLDVLAACCLCRVPLPALGLQELQERLERELERGECQTPRLKRRFIYHSYLAQ
jgi:hypothetical protein